MVGIWRPVRFTFFEEAVASLLCFFGHVRQPSGFASEDLLTYKAVVDQVECELGHTLRCWALAADLASPLQRFGLEFGMRDDSVHDTLHVRFGSGVGAAEEEDFSGKLLTDLAGE